MRIRPHLLLLAAAAGASSCSGWLFSTAIPQPDRTRPVALVELRGSPARLAATTAEGIVFLNDDGASGACRVHYFLGPDLVVEDGVVGKLGGGYAVAVIDLKSQAVPVLKRELTAEDELVALVLDGDDVERVDVELADDPAVKGYALEWPGRELPAGAGIFRIRTGRNSGDLQFVGLCRGLATLTTAAGAKRFVTFTGPARMREALANPRPMFGPRSVKYRPDGIQVVK